MLFFSEAYAQATTATGAPAVNPILQFVPFILIFGVFYFFVIRPQQKRVKIEQDMIGKLKKGDEIYTKSGMIGTIHNMGDKVVTLEVSEGTRLKFLRSQIGGLAKPIIEGKAQEAMTT